MAGSLLMLGKTYKDGKDKVGGGFISEKVDGTRCFWDGGVSRSVPTTQIPWANLTDPKTGMMKKKILPVASGLWSRYGNPIMAPDWWLNQLPCCPLDGELWAGRGNFQECRSIVGRDEPDDRWTSVHFVVFGSPSPANVFSKRIITGANIKLSIDPSEIYGFVEGRLEELEDYQALISSSTFEEEMQFLRTALPPSETVYLHEQVQLPGDHDQARDEVYRFMDKVLARGGEGVVIRRSGSVWLPKRTSDLLKVKPFTDDKAVITGFTSGRETDKGSKNRGKIGALITQFQGKRLELSGMTDVQRLFLTEEMEQYAYANPGVDMPEHFQGMGFRVGGTVEFRYRELSDDGIPKEARFMRNV